MAHIFWLAAYLRRLSVLFQGYYFARKSLPPVRPHASCIHMLCTLCAHFLYHCLHQLFFTGGRFHAFHMYYFLILPFLFPLSCFNTFRIYFYLFFKFCIYLFVFTVITCCSKFYLLILFLDLSMFCYIISCLLVE